MLVALLASSLLTGSLTGCGFQLRGYDAPMQLLHSDTVLMIDDDRTTFLLKRPLIERLQAVGVTVVDGLAMLESQSLQSQSASQSAPIGIKHATLSGSKYNAAIKVSNVRFQKYELVGVLTEIRQVISADVTYQIQQNGQITQVSNPIQVQRSYQYNAASVSTEDQQGEQIKDWLYESLARRITDQYVALSLPKVAPKPVGNDADNSSSKAAANTDR